MNIVYIVLATLAWFVVGVFVAALTNRFVERYTWSYSLDRDEPIDWLLAGAMVVAWPMILLWLVLGIIGRRLVRLIDRLSGV